MRRRLVGGELIAQRLDELGLSQSELAARLGVSEASVSRWISGERTVSAPFLVPLGRELDVDPEHLLPLRTGT